MVSHESIDLVGQWQSWAREMVQERVLRHTIIREQYFYVEHEMNRESCNVCVMLPGPSGTHISHEGPDS